MTREIIENIFEIVPEFSGKTAGDLQIFLDVARAYYQVLGPSEQTIFLSLLPNLKLRGVPYELCKGRNFKTFDELQLVLTEYYLPQEDLSGLTQEMQDCRQLQGETARQFGRRVEVRLRKCELYLTRLCEWNPQPFLEEYQRMAIQTFRRGLLSPSLKQFSCMLNESDFSKMITKVSEMESLENHCQAPYNYCVQQLVGTQEPLKQHQLHFRDSQQPVTWNDQGRRFQQEAPVRRQGKNAEQEEKTARQDRKQLLCYKCGLPNHIRGQCRASVFCQHCRTNHHDTQVCPGKARHEVRRSQMEAVCDFCLDYGHKIEECAAKRKWDARTTEKAHQGNEFVPIEGQSPPIVSTSCFGTGSQEAPADKVRMSSRTPGNNLLATDLFSAHCNLVESSRKRDFLGEGNNQSTFSASILGNVTPKREINTIDQCKKWVGTPRETHQIETERAKSFDVDTVLKKENKKATVGTEIRGEESSSANITNTFMGIEVSAKQKRYKKNKEGLGRTDREQKQIISNNKEEERIARIYKLKAIKGNIEQDIKGLGTKEDSKWNEKAGFEELGETSLAREGMMGKSEEITEKREIKELQQLVKSKSNQGQRAREASGDFRENDPGKLNIVKEYVENREGENTDYLKEAVEQENKLEQGNNLEFKTKNLERGIREAFYHISGNKELCKKVTSSHIAGNAGYLVNTSGIKVHYQWEGDMGSMEPIRKFRKVGIG